MSVVGVVRFLVSAGFAASLVYTVFAIFRVAVHRIRRRAISAFSPPVSVLKPVCGVDAGLEENLRTYFEQDYPDYQVVFGARDAEDPALPVVRRVVASYPRADVAMAGEPYRGGTNRKVNNLVTICREAKHDILVVADSDVRVGPDYVRNVAAPFEDDAVGAVTCLTVAEPVPGVASRLGAMFVNGEFLPSILVALAVQPLDYCFGPTMAARRSALEAIGGFEALSMHLADDYLLGNLISRRGMKVALADGTVTNVLHEPSIRKLFLHELRWARTIRTLRPAGYTATVITLILPWAVALLVAFGFSPAAWIAFGGAVAARLALHAAVHARFRLSGAWQIWWIPLRDVLSFSVYCSSHLGSGVLWRGNRFNVSRDGRLHRGGESEA